MKKRTKYKNKILNIMNVNKKDKYKRRYMFLGVKLTIKNKKKYDFYKEQKQILNNKLYQERKKILDTLKPLRKNIKPVLTCYINTYNQQNTIEKAIKSILEQKTKYPYLIKISDDFSTDKTFDICLEYAKKYPEKIELVIPPQNTKCLFISSVYRTINTKYFCVLDGDDYWCDDSKIETALDFLEANPKYITWGSDTTFHDMETGRKYSYTFGLLKRKKITNPVTFDNYVYIHVSARIHRNIIDFKKEYEKIRKRDIFIYHLFLSKGPLYFYNKQMSVCNFTKKGVFSKLTALEQYYSTKYSYYANNKHLKYVKDAAFTKLVNSKCLKLSKFFLGKRLGWKIYILFKKISIIYETLKIKIKSLNNIEHKHEPYPKEEFIDMKKLAENISKNI